jgi:hypothetical protein
MIEYRNDTSQKAVCDTPSSIFDPVTDSPTWALPVALSRAARYKIGPTLIFT